jgi:uncharacterized protein
MIAWQGGEPTLMGRDFLRRTMALEQALLKPAMTIENTIQTNGILANEDWFLHDSRILVGLSMGGPKALHHFCHKDKGGHGTFDRVVATARRH